MIEKIKVYLEAKNGENEKQTLFGDMIQPSRELVGMVVPLNGGHTKEFNLKEESLLDAHLAAANFGSFEDSQKMDTINVNESRESLRGHL